MFYARLSYFAMNMQIFLHIFSTKMHSVFLWDSVSFPFFANCVFIQWRFDTHSLEMTNDQNEIFVQPS